jgi:DNA polymerase-3 subunit gamma/tau
VWSLCYFIKGFDAPFCRWFASHFRDLLVSKTPSTLSLLEVGEQAQKMYGLQAQKCESRFFFKRNCHCK